MIISVGLRSVCTEGSRRTTVDWVTATAARWSCTRRAGASNRGRWRRRSIPAKRTFSTVTAIAVPVIYFVGGCLKRIPSESSTRTIVDWIISVAARWSCTRRASASDRGGWGRRSIPAEVASCSTVTPVAVPLVGAIWLFSVCTESTYRASIHCGIIALPYDGDGGIIPTERTRGTAICSIAVPLICPVRLYGVCAESSSCTTICCRHITYTVDGTAGARSKDLSSPKLLRPF